MRAAAIELTEPERVMLRSWLAAGKTERRMAFRAEVILAVAGGLGNAAVAERLETRPATVSKWRGRFARDRFGGSGGCAAQRQAAVLPERRRETPFGRVG